MSARQGRPRLPKLGYGGGTLFPVSGERDAEDVLAHAYERGFRYFDTAPFYARGLGEHWFGAALRQRNRDDFLLSTKVGRLLRPNCGAAAHDGLAFDIGYDYSYDGALRSLDDSLQRLGLCRVDIVYLHDVNPRWQGADYERRFDEAMRGAYPALERLRAEGVVRAIGVGVKGADVCLRFARAGDFDFFMLAGGYTLLDHADALDAFLPHCERNGIGVVVASPFNSGILATGAVSGATFFYAEAPAEIVDRTRRLQAICDEHHVPLGAAALQFTLAHPAVASAVCGYRTTREVDTNLAWSTLRIPAELWRTLEAERLIDERASTPDRT
ncbi:MAG TPA: aldo/keto reductase [Casimicrobiaceae bacterium]|nr:aldo/keto reductase [Casimicrobiaceae bacterium]